MWKSKDLKMVRYGTFNVMTIKCPSIYLLFVRKSNRPDHTFVWNMNMDQTSVWAFFKVRRCFKSNCGRENYIKLEAGEERYVWTRTVLTGSALSTIISCDCSPHNQTWSKNTWKTFKVLLEKLVFGNTDAVPPPSFPAPILIIFIFFSFFCSPVLRFICLQRRQSFVWKRKKKKKKLKRKGREKKEKQLWSALSLIVKSCQCANKVGASSETEWDFI